MVMVSRKREGERPNRKISIGEVELNLTKQEVLLFSRKLFYCLDFVQTSLQQVYSDFNQRQVHTPLCSVSPKSEPEENWGKIIQK